MSLVTSFVKRMRWLSELEEALARHRAGTARLSKGRKGLRKTTDDEKDQVQCVLGHCFVFPDSGSLARRRDRDDLPRCRRRGAVLSTWRAATPRPKARGLDEHRPGETDHRRSRPPSCYPRRSRICRAGCSRSSDEYRAQDPAFYSCARNAELERRQGVVVGQLKVGRASTSLGNTPHPGARHHRPRRGHIFQALEGSVAIVHVGRRVGRAGVPAYSIARLQTLGRRVSLRVELREEAFGHFT